MPEKTSVMINFVQCSMAIFGDKGKYCITCKQGLPDFHLFSRKYYHDFKVPISTADFEGAHGISIDAIGVLLVACRGNILCYDATTYEFKYRLVDLLCHEEDDDILYMTASKDGEQVAVTMGYSRLDGEEAVEKIILLQLEPGTEG